MIEPTNCLQNVETITRANAPSWGRALASAGLVLAGNHRGMPGSSQCGDNDHCTVYMMGQAYHNEDKADSAIVRTWIVL